MTTLPTHASFPAGSSNFTPVSVKLLHVVGARPNFPKLAPVHRAGVAASLTQVVVHTGQHYDDDMSARFFRELGIPAPDINLGVGSGSHAAQTARIMERFEAALLDTKPDWVVVYGDVNSTMAASIVASKLGVRVVHVEAGLRSDDRGMPEEINRLVTDRLADLLLTPSHDASQRLRDEGEPEHEIVFVGNVMIDSLFHTLPVAADTGFAAKHGLDGSHVMVTMHRPSNVDDPERLRAIVTALDEIAKDRTVIFPVHPRTAARLKELDLSFQRVRTLDPIGYPEMLDAMRNAWAVVTDSGGLQEETTALGVPCFTLRDNTERPVTISEGTNVLVKDPAQLVELVRQNAKRGTGSRPDGWDGKAGVRVIEALRAYPR